MRYSDQNNKDNKEEAKETIGANELDDLEDDIGGEKEKDVKKNNERFEIEIKFIDNIDLTAKDSHGKVVTVVNKKIQDGIKFEIGSHGGQKAHKGKPK